MRFDLLLISLGALAFTASAQGLGRAPDRPAKAIGATCSAQSGDKQLSRVSADYIEVRSGSSSRSVPIGDIESIEVTGPVNRANHFAWATVKTTGGDVQKVGLVLPDAGTLLIDGVTAQGKADSIDVLECRRVTFKAG